MVDIRLVRGTLRRLFGSATADSPGFSEGALSVLCSWVPGRESFSDAARRMEDYLFNALYDRLGPGMTLRLEDGSVRRVLMADLPRLADEAMYPLFFSLKPWSVDYERLHSFWMESGSLSAMRALYLRFYDFLPAQDRLLIERVARENIPPSRLEGWLNPEEG